MQGQELDGTFEAASSHAPLQCDHPPLQVNGVADEATLCVVDRFDPPCAELELDEVASATPRGPLLILPPLQIDQSKKWPGLPSCRNPATALMCHAYKVRWWWWRWWLTSGGWWLAERRAHGPASGCRRCSGTLPARPA